VPHEVIMPALGMAQDTGLIVAWRKTPGDAVASGDILMEVETDKATMEVEAGADGFLTELRAEAGDNVPVGDVVALISDTADTVKAAPAPKPEANDGKSAAPAQGKTVIMPALGMAQDTGLLVVWRKQPGDAVSASDILLEVETDKSTMEVEAGHDGYVAELRAEAGDNVPVGDVIAVITKDKPDAPVQKKAETPKPAPAAKFEAREPLAKPVSLASRSRPALQPVGGRILASPKARRLAAEQGLDLSRLAEEGFDQPYHVADLDRLKALPRAATAGVPAPQGRVSAEVPDAAFAAFFDWLEAETNSPAATAVIFAAFTAGSLRAVDSVATILVKTENPVSDTQALYGNPDLHPLSAIEPLTDVKPPALVLRDMTGSRITGINTGIGAVPVVTITRSGGIFRLTLDYPSGALAEGAAIMLVSGFAARLEDPLRHLL
jgi:pyruvate/2-oxoglutarate dehydrogenase complex dihydrolipoamide acyltransferase (E2) component